MNAEISEIINFFIGHVLNAENSNRLELYAFLKVFNYLLESGLEMSSTTTDRHKSIRKYLKENCPNIVHHFNVWHISKTMKKSLCSKGKLTSPWELMDLGQKMTQTKLKTYVWLPYVGNGYV